MSVMLSKRQRWGLGVSALIVVLATVAAIAASEPSASTAPSPSADASVTPSPSSVELTRVGGSFLAVPDRTIDDPTLLPYPFMSPTPPPTSSALDGTYLRAITLQQVGGARIGLPNRCLRCPPFRIDAGISTLIFTRGAYYLHHHLSGFRTMGSFVVDGDRVTLFNDANCPQKPGIYEFEITAHGLRLRVVEDDCPYAGERAGDLMVTIWTRIPACVRRIQNLWPGEVAC
jgi:hypothetical protein